MGSSELELDKYCQRTYSSNSYCSKGECGDRWLTSLTVLSLKEEWMSGTPLFQSRSRCASALCTEEWESKSVTCKGFISTFLSFRIWACSYQLTYAHNQVYFSAEVSYSYSIAKIKGDKQCHLDTLPVLPQGSGYLPLGISLLEALTVLLEMLMCSVTTLDTLLYQTPLGPTVLYREVSLIQC